MNRIAALSSLVLLAALAACGGGGGDDPADPNPDPGGGGGDTVGTLTLSDSTPAANDGAIDLDTALAISNEAREPDGAFDFKYCAINFDEALSANGTKYSLQVYFRQSDGAVINVNVGDATFAWLVGETVGSTPITGVTVDVATRQISFEDKSMNNYGDDSAKSTLSGTLTFPANATVAACGA